MTIKNILLKIQYDGSGFSGYQIQPNKRSIQEELEKAIRKVTRENNRIIAAGRTDAGVHANCQYINFLTASNIKADKFSYHLRPFLPNDILVLSSKEVALNFHARFSAHKKTYRYVISTKKVLHPIYRNYMQQVTYKLDREKLAQGLEILKGDHDFKSFMFTTKNAIINTRRKIDEAYYIEKNERIDLIFEAESFLHNQVRIMAGSLVELARGRISIEKFKSYLDPDNSERANPTLGPGGLYLERIEY
ncbi:MAG: tRNA pseudouridine(38-40) synthase TruA [Peptoniphilaceae bacterium]|nr:tRNA pseudouridine(38-40) synthase TruA [Peptoniphilaceae bacterium]MDY6019766.1 tRNA pseudouridine(38-40) synthase TruA [Anaerococcus sp.]